jgi:hypothetical protein
MTGGRRGRTFMVANLVDDEIEAGKRASFSS